MIAVNLHKSSTFIAMLIKWQTRSPYSHVSVTLTDGTIIEAKEGKGVRHLTPTDLDWHKYRELIRQGKIEAYRADVPADAVPVIEAFLKREIGAKYDWLGVVRFVSRRKHRANGKWFCSELASAAFEAAGVPLLLRVPSWNVSPGDLVGSHRLSPLAPAAALD